MPPTIQYKQIYGDIISEDILEFWKSLIYNPLIEVLQDHFPKDIKLNAKDLPGEYLLKKIKNSEIIYDGKYFYGKIDAKVSKELKEYGATWDASRKSFKLATGKLTPDLKTAVTTSASRLKTMNTQLELTLDTALNNSSKKLDEFDMGKGLDKVIKSLQEQAITATEKMGVSYTLTAGMKETLKQDYTQNMKLYIKDWTETHIKKLRRDVQDNAMQGYRADQLMDLLETRFGTTKAKAEFLAKQETSLFMSKFRRERFTDAGLNYYRWSTSKDRRVRPDHQKLDGKIFIFGSPPIVDSSTGRRAEPGEDFGCRCIAIPVTSEIRKIHGEYVIIS